MFGASGGPGQYTLRVETGVTELQSAVRIYLCVCMHALDRSPRLTDSDPLSICLLYLTPSTHTSTLKQTTQQVPVTGHVTTGSSNVYKLWNGDMHAKILVSATTLSGGNGGGCVGYDVEWARTHSP